MEHKQETFQKFGKNFQENLCHLMLQDRTFCDQISEVIDVEFIQYEHLRIFVKNAYRLQIKVQTTPVL